MKRVFFSLAVVALLTSGCNKDVDDLKSVVTVGLYVLSEGDWNVGNGQLVYFDYNSDTDRFVRNNDKRFQNFGEMPNDMVIYGSKMYAAITGSGSDVGDGMVRVINPSNGEIITDIVITKDAAEQMPRRLAATGGKVYVTLYSGALAQIDTAMFTYDVISLNGTFSDGICIYGQSLFICNSGQGAGNTVSIVNISTFTQTETITVPYNPVNIVNAGNGELYLNTATVWDNWEVAAPPNVHVLNATSKTVTQTLNVAVENLAVGKDYVYGVGFDWSSFGTTLKKINIADKTVSEFTETPQDYSMGYKLSVNPLTNDVFLTDMGQNVYRFEEDGTYVETLQIGQNNGAAVVFIDANK